jgi:AcrR family transcriptional regulator
MSPQTATPDRRVDPRVTRTRKILEDAFTELLSERKFREISVQDIANRATVNRATFYAHFDDKYDLLDQLVRAWFRREVIGRMPEGEADRHQLRWFVVATLEELAAMNRQCHDSRVEPVAETRIQQEIKEFLAGCFAHHLGAGRDPRPRPEVAAAVLSWAIFGAGMEWSRMPSQGRPSIDEMADEIMTLLPPEV